MICGDFLLVLLGAACATFGGFLQTWFSTRKARDKRFKEIVGEKCVSVCAEALSVVNEATGRWQQDEEKTSLKWVDQKTDWVWQNVAYLPSGVYNRWLTVRKHMRKVIRDRGNLESGNKEGIDELGKLEQQIKVLLREADSILRRRFDLQPFEWIDPKAE